MHYRGNRESGWCEVFSALPIFEDFLQMAMNKTIPT